MVIDHKTIETHLPYYLTQEQKRNLSVLLSEFKDKPIDYYVGEYPNDMLQGDGWKGFELLRFENGERKKINGIVLSNTCDISQDNRRYLPVNVTFAPIVRLSNYSERLRNAAISAEQIENKFRVIREQKVTTMFYLPASEALGGECIALLDDLHTIPAQALQIGCNCRKLFTLSMAGFYLFLLKISVHFCRFHEGLPR